MKEIHVNQRLYPYFKKFTFYSSNTKSGDHVGYFLHHKLFINNEVLGWEFRDPYRLSQKNEDIQVD